MFAFYSNEPSRSPWTFWITFIDTGVTENLWNMGARVARMFRNFNLENRVHREISKEKPIAAPRHAAGDSDGKWLTAPLTCVTVSSEVMPACSGRPHAYEWSFPGEKTSGTLSLLTSMLCVSAAEKAGSVHQKNDPLLKLLKSVYVESQDPAAEVRMGHRLCPFVLHPKGSGWMDLHATYH